MHYFRCKRGNTFSEIQWKIKAENCETVTFKHLRSQFFLHEPQKGCLRLIMWNYSTYITDIHWRRMAICFIQTLVHAPTLLALVFSMPASRTFLGSRTCSVFTQSLNTCYGLHAIIRKLNLLFPLTLLLNTILPSTWPQPLATFNPFLAFSQGNFLWHYHQVRFLHYILSEHFSFWTLLSRHYSHFC